MQINSIKGLTFALFAAMLNASIGVISILLINSGLSSEEIAFLKTILAYFIISIILFKTPNKTQKANISLKKRNALLYEIGICAFLGIFILFFFETIAYNYGSPPNVIVVLMATATLSALFLGAIILKEKISLNAIAGVASAILGIAIISWKGDTSFLLLINAIIAGLGYGCFTILVKKFSLNGGIFLTKYLLMFGSIYLLIPFLVNFKPINFDVSIGLGILCLAIFPTILGFYCTTKALQYLTASKVQVAELSEPIFFCRIYFDYIPNITQFFFFYRCRTDYIRHCFYKRNKNFF